MSAIESSELSSPSLSFLSLGRHIASKNLGAMEARRLLYTLAIFAFLWIRSEGHPACYNEINLEWSVHVSGSIVSTPRIATLQTTGLKDILIPTYSQYLEVLNGLHGDEVPGFPFMSPHFTSYSSPLPIDIDGDGTVDWLVGLYSGKLLIISENGEPKSIINIPSLIMKKNWIADNISLDSVARLQTRPTQPSETEDLRKRRKILHLHVNRESPRVNNTSSRRRRVRLTDHVDAEEKDFVNAHDYHDESKARDSTPLSGKFNREAKESMNLLLHPELFSSMSRDDDDEFLVSPPQSGYPHIADDEVEVDAHILSTPVIADINNDGDPDVLIHVSFFFDPDDASASPDVNMKDYVATALLCINLVTSEVEWYRMLHITSSSDLHPSYALSSPLVLNADRAGEMEVYVTSTTGSIYGFNASGGLLPGWPAYVAPITGSPAAEDVQGKGTLSICTGDTSGMVSCFDPEGKAVWQTHVDGAVSDRVTFGDIDGDGMMDVVFGTTSGHIYALHGVNGSVKHNFPLKTSGPIIAPLLLLNIGRSRSDALHLIVPSHDGNLYIADGKGGCMDAITIDEKSSTMVLADDITGNGKMDLLVTTLRGGVLLFETQAEFHPLKRWPSKIKGINDGTASENGVGVFITDAFRQPRDVRGPTFQLEISIQDHMTTKKSYTVDIFIGPRIQVFHGVFQQPGKQMLRVRTPLQRMYGNVVVVMRTPAGQTYTDEVSLSFNMHYLEGVKFTLLIPFLIISCALMMIKEYQKIEAAGLQGIGIL